MIEWHFFDKVYRSWVTLVVGEPEDFYSFMERCGYKEMEALKEGSTTGWCIHLNSDNNDMGNDCFVVWMRKFEMGTFVHELTHLTMMIFDDKGVPVRGENTEAFAYYTEFWYNEITRARRRQPKGRPAKEAKK